MPSPDPSGFPIYTGPETAEADEYGRPPRYATPDNPDDSPNTGPGDVARRVFNPMRGKGAPPRRAGQ